MEEQKYKCPDCGWVGTEDEMRTSYELIYDDDEDDEIVVEEEWSNWICPHCGMWYTLKDYEEV